MRRKIVLFLCILLGLVISIGIAANIAWPAGTQLKIKKMFFITDAEIVPEHGNYIARKSDVYELGDNVDLYVEFNELTVSEGDIVFLQVHVQVVEQETGQIVIDKLIVDHCGLLPSGMSLDATFILARLEHLCVGVYQVAVTIYDGFTDTSVTEILSFEVQDRAITI